MKCNTRYVTAIVSVLLCVGLLVSFAALTQAQSATGRSLVNAAPGIIFGVVEDSLGNPVSNATVTLWQQGKLWQSSGVVWGSGLNPQTTAYYQYGSDMPEGSFAFGIVQPGSYLLTAEKGGYSKTVIINIQGSMPQETFDSAVMPVEQIDFHLGEYPFTFYPEVDRSNAGAITGFINGSRGLASGVNVTLMQGGNVVSMVRNPQISSDRVIPEDGGNYLFEHLARGQYRVVIETIGEFGEPCRAYKAVYVDNETQVVSFEIPSNVTSDQATPVPSIRPAPTATPMPPAASEVSPAAIPSDVPVATPAPISELMSIVGVLGATFVLCMRKRL